MIFENNIYCWFLAVIKNETFKDVDYFKELNPFQIIDITCIKITMFLIICVSTISIVLSAPDFLN